ncbi:MAG: glucose-1-phosphate adenylyltransferase family protein [Dehalococcoidales bacterium]
MDKMIAAILAGGKGTRMDIFCQVRPKPALPFAGKYRFIDFCLSNCLHSKITDVAVFVDYRRAQLSGYLDRWQIENSRNTKIDVLEPDNNGAYLGTANAVYQKLDFLRNHSADKILIMPSDHAYKMDYRKMLAFHNKSGADVTVGVVPVPIEEAHRFGTLTLGDNGYVTEYIEKPDVPKSNLVSMGIYIFNKDILISRLVRDAAELSSLHDFGYSIIPGMVGQDKVYAYKFDSFWRDIGTIDAYYDTSMELTGSKPPFSLTGTWPVLTCQTNEQTKQFAHSHIQNSIISPGCVIKGHVENSILSPGVHVEEQAVVKNSIIMSNVFIGVHSIVDSCIADEDVNIGDFCYLGFGKNNNNNREYILLGKGSSISAHTAIARGCKITPYSSPTDALWKVAGNYHPVDKSQLQLQNSNRNI